MISPALDPLPSFIPPPPRFRCPRCAFAFETQAELADHITNGHQHRQRLFMIDGREPPGTHTLRAAFVESSIRTLFCTEVDVKVDGRYLPGTRPNGPGAARAAQAEARVLLRLKNAADPGMAPEVSFYDIRLQTPDLAALVQVETAFIHHTLTTSALCRAAR